MSKLTLTRRSFLKAAAVTGAAAALASVTASNALANTAVTPLVETGVKRIRTSCRGCGKMECGAIVTVQDGKAIRVEGDPTSFQSMGNCCTKSQSSIQACYHPDRLHYPYKRSNPKDADDPGWTRISWDEALSTVVGKFNELQAKYGGESLFGQCGTSRHWCMFGASNGMWLWDSPNITQAWQICKGPRHFASAMTSAFTLPWMETVARPRVYVAWGGASEISNYDDSCRTTVDVAARADYHICVDPRVTNNGKEADFHMHLRPGTDGAMALAWANVIIENDLIDDLFVKKWTVGPMLVVSDMEATGFPSFGLTGTPYNMTTNLLKQSDLQEGGDPHKFYVWDTIADRLVYFDATTGLWEGQVWHKPTAGRESTQNVYGAIPGFVIDPTPFDPEIDPALYGEYDVTLKDGRTVKAVPTFDLYAQRCAEYTPEVVEGICDVPAKAIREAALTYATRLDPTTGYGNGGIQFMLATEHACTSIQNVRALESVTAITGNIDTPAGHRASTKAPIEGGQMGFANNGSGMPMLSPGQYEKTLGIPRVPLLHWWGMWANSTDVWDAALTGEPYPIVGGFNSSGNFRHQCNSTLVWEAMLKLEFYAENNLWHTPGGTTCDIVMPVLHWIEVDSPRSGQGACGAMGANVACVNGPGETMFDGEIIREFYRYKGMPYNVIPGFPEYPSYEQMLDMSVMGFEPKGWKVFVERFAEHGWWDCKIVEPDQWGTYRRYETGFMRARNMGGFVGSVGDFLPGFYTNTMKMESWYSTIMETYHPDGKWTLPTYTEPPHSPVSDPEQAKDYPLICTTGRRIPVYFHSEHRQLPWCRELWPVPRVEINPATAKDYGIEQGDWVWIESPYGKVRQVADLYYGIKANTINCEHTWWFPELEQAGKGFELCQINQLIDHEANDPHCGSSNLRGYQVKIYKATPENCPDGKVIPCGHDGTPIIHESTDPRLDLWLPVYEGRE
ncbi:MAG: molybdopterin-dependent oxidoreductase [Coriobacteriales bacterium]|nr:molybdopterin-dependent oxidoreductase [Coriobacteriales bacterium]